MQVIQIISTRLKYVFVKHFFITYIPNFTITCHVSFIERMNDNNKITAIDTM